MTAIVLTAIRVYRSCVSGFLPPCCRYYPSCSSYAEEAVRRHGCWKGGVLAVRRLMRCGPWGSHGFDPVP